MANYQSNRSSCGPAALRNALLALGIERTEEELSKLSGQTPDGVGARGLLKAIRAIQSDTVQLRGHAMTYRNRWEAGVGLWYWTSDQGRPFLLCVDDLDHWVTCVGHLGVHFNVVDSADNRLILHYDNAGLTARWGYPSAAEKRKYYGIVV